MNLQQTKVIKRLLVVGDILKTLSIWMPLSKLKVKMMISLHTALTIHDVEYAKRELLPSIATILSHLSLLKRPQMLMMMISLALSPALSLLCQAQTVTSARSPIWRWVISYCPLLLLTSTLQLAEVLFMKTIAPCGGNADPNACHLCKNHSMKSKWKAMAGHLADTPQLSKWAHVEEVEDDDTMHSQPSSSQIPAVAKHSKVIVSESQLFMAILSPVIFSHMDQQIPSTSFMKRCQGMLMALRATWVTNITSVTMVSAKFWPLQRQCEVASMVSVTF
jgi:hypothetical protein